MPGDTGERRIKRVVGVMLACHSDEVTRDVEVAAETLYRTLFALAAEEVMFDAREVNGFDVLVARRDAEIVSLLVNELKREA